jgi:hypothetical protein
VESNQTSATVERARQYFGEVRERDLPALPPCRPASGSGSQPNCCATARPAGVGLGPVLGHAPGGLEDAGGPLPVVAAGQEPHAAAAGGEDIRSGGQVMLAGLMAIAGPAPVPSADQRGPAGQAQDGRAVRA